MAARGRVPAARAGGAGTPLLETRLPVAAAGEIWMVAAGNASLPLSGNGENLNRLLHGTEYATLSVRLTDRIDLEVVGVCRGSEPRAAVGGDRARLPHAERCRHGAAARGIGAAAPCAAQPRRSRDSPDSQAQPAELEPLSRLFRSRPPHRRGLIISSVPQRHSYRTPHALRLRTCRFRRSRDPWIGFRLVAGVLLLAAAIVFTWLTIDGLSSRRKLRTELAEISHVRYGLLNADRWVEKIVPILDARIDALDLKEADRASLRPIVENALYRLLDDVKEKTSAKDSQEPARAGSWDRGTR